MLPLKNFPEKGNFLYKGKKIILDPFTQAEFHYEVFQDKVEGKLRLLGREIRLSECEAIFPCCFLYGSILRKLPDDLDWEWIERVYPYPKPLNEAFFLNAVDADYVIWKQPKQSISLEIIPFLQLKDRTGAFADLWMDYGNGKKVAFHDPLSFLERQREVEKQWQRDLLETNFIEKQVDTSHYYCPLDKVAKSLTFILEIGWRIFDYLDREVIRQTGKALTLGLEGEHIAVRGEISYGTHQADLENVLGAFNRRSQFVDLSDGVVGLLDLPKEWEDLPHTHIPKTHFALLESFFSDPEIVRDKAVAELAERLKNNKGIITTAPASSFQGTLYPYQQEGLSWLSFLYKSGFHGLLADEMGLGKTVQVLSFLSLVEKQPVLIVMPTSLLFNWKRELARFLPQVLVYEHTGPERLKEKELLEEKQVILTSYALLRLDASLLQSLDYACVILDEAQAIKNAHSQVAKAAFAIKSVFRLAITGTPIENRWEDLWSLFFFLMPELLGNSKNFELSQVKKKVRPFILRRTKEEAEIHLPPKVEQVVWVEMGEEQKAFYEVWLLKSRKGLDPSSPRLEILEAILRLRQICCHPLLLEESLAPSGKLERLLEDLEDVVANRRKVLVYSQFTSMLRLIEKEIIAKNWSYVYLDGTTQDRESCVTQFQEDPSVSIFLISLKAGGTGLNLTAADYVFLYDPWWNEAAEMQAIDRAHRIGRGSSVIARRYVTVESIEEKIMRLKEHKSSLALGLLDFEGEISSLSIQELYACLSCS